MKYKVVYDKTALKSIQKLEIQTKKQIKKIDENLMDTNNPRNSQWKSLKGKYKGKGRYKVGNYRILAQIKDDEIIIYIFEIAHRREVYQK